jgi:hypothetical protein
MQSIRTQNMHLVNASVTLVLTPCGTAVKAEFGHSMSVARDQSCSSHPATTYLRYVLIWSRGQVKAVLSEIIAPCDNRCKFCLQRYTLLRGMLRIPDELQPNSENYSLAIHVI